MYCSHAQHKGTKVKRTEMQEESGTSNSFPVINIWPLSRSQLETPDQRHADLEGIRKVLISDLIINAETKHTILDTVESGQINGVAYIMLKEVTSLKDAVF